MAPSSCVFDIRRYSVRDGPGIRTTVFFKGCPLRCAWCHNPESQGTHAQLLIRDDRCLHCGACVDACPNGAIAWQGGRRVTDFAACAACGACASACPAEARAIVGRTMAVDEVLDEVERDRLFFDASGGGVTFSGGEPLFQSAFLLALLDGCRDRGIHATVDTSGHAPTPVALAVGARSDLILYDLKHMDPDRHQDGTGVDNALILDNLRRLAATGVRLVVRVPLVPGFNDDEANLAGTAAFVGALMPVPRVQLLPFHRTAADKHRRFGLPYRRFDDHIHDPAELNLRRSWFERAGVPAEIGG